MSITANEIRTIARGETNKGFVIDWGDNTPGRLSGPLSGGDTVATCTVSVIERPPGALQVDDPTLSAVSLLPNTADADGNYGTINGRVWESGQATVCTITTSATQAYGMYKFRFVATTTNGNILPRPAVIEVVPQ